MLCDATHACLCLCSCLQAISLGGSRPWAMGDANESPCLDAERFKSIAVRDVQIYWNTCNLTYFLTSIVSPVVR